MGLEVSRRCYSSDGIVPRVKIGEGTIMVWLVSQELGLFPIKETLNASAPKGFGLSYAPNLERTVRGGPFPVPTCTSDKAWCIKTWKSVWMYFIGLHRVLT